MSVRFNSSFWLNKLRELGYPLKQIDLDVKTLRDQKALPVDFEGAKVSKLYSDDFIEVVLLKVDYKLEGKRSLCTRTAKSWKENRLIKPLLLFTDESDSYAIVVPGKGIGGEAKVLGLSDTLYRTDSEVLESMRFPGNADSLSSNYDSSFFPYQKVRDEFFEGYKLLYGKVEKAVKKELKTESTSYSQRFLGRLMFLYFLQRKSWLKENKHFVDTIKDFKELNKLFYESLNQEGIHGIPFLNGSLFEKEPYMNVTAENNLFPKLDKLFKEARNFFNGYNFTVDETSPLEVEVSIDPALIGTVFENMLPENERGAKGTFYTHPAEISFICRRAVTNYLGYPDEVSEDGKTFIDGLSRYVEKLAKDKSDKEVREFRDKLLSLRVLDPAVGSGGFLLAMMQEIIRIIQEAEATVGWRSDPEELKKRMLPNLYGFDIEPEAIEIARLRLWLSLIIDQKDPEPLPNLDLSLIVIKDSLVKPESQRTLDPKIEELRENFVETRSKYLNEHDSKSKKKLKGHLQEIAEKTAHKSGIDPSVIEAYMPQKAQLIVMNPPYVRQEALPQKKKDYYVNTYSISKKTDLFGYFLIRTLSLLTDDGVAAVISSDKWLETDYGVSIQEKLKDHLMAIYGQKERSFGADINTVISVYSYKKTDQPLGFTYIESYGGKGVRRHLARKKNELTAGKWFYLRAPTVFIKQILPSLPYRLARFGEIKYGIKTGANEFFYMKSVSDFFESDYLTDPTRFKKMGLTTQTKKDLEELGLIYIENEAGERFVINQGDVTPVVRSPRQLETYFIHIPDSLCLNIVDDPGKFTKKYIAFGEARTIEITRGVKERTITGYNNVESIRNRSIWFKLPELKLTKILLQKSMMDRLYVPFCQKPILCDNRFYALYCKNPEKVWLYLNSTVFLLTMELFCRRLGGGAADIMVEDYNSMPVPDLEKITIEYDKTHLSQRKVLRYADEVKQEDRQRLDMAVLKAMGFEKPEDLIDDLYSAFTEVVKDRIVKARIVSVTDGNTKEEPKTQ